MKVESLSEPLVECWIARVEAIEQRALIKLLGTSQVSIRPVSREFLELEHFDGHRALVSRDILIGMGLSTLRASIPLYGRTGELLEVF